MVNALTNFETPITMHAYLFLWMVALFLMLWSGGVTLYHYLPRNEMGEKFIPGVNIVLSDMGVCAGQECCGARYYDTNTNISNWTIIIVCFPLLMDSVLSILCLFSVFGAMSDLQRNFGINFLIASDTYSGTYTVFFDLTTFYSTFANPAGTSAAPDGTVVHFPQCLNYDPVTAIKTGIAFGFIFLALQMIVWRVSTVSYACFYCSLLFVGNVVLTLFFLLLRVYRLLMSDCCPLLLEDLQEVSYSPESADHSHPTVGDDLRRR